MRNARSMSRLERKNGARSRATVRRSANVSAATTPLTAAIWAAPCRATAAPSDVPIKKIGPEGIVATTDARSFLS
jgi:hypothetical protein